MGKSGAKQKKSAIYVRQVAGSSHVTGLNLLLVGENHWTSGFESHPTDSQGNSLVALRTVHGVGEITLELADREVKHSLGPSSLILFDDRFLAKYRVIGDQWHTHWYDFVADDPSTLLLNECWNVPRDNAERTAFRTIRDEIESTSAGVRRVACARFGLMLRGWLAKTSAGDWADDDFACTERAVAVMYRNLHEPLGIERISREAGVSPAALRRAFAARIGLSPKKFYNRLRMNEAARLLGTGHSVAETAEKMGFSDAFHFSRAFKRYFQVAPKTKKPRRSP